MTSNKNQGLFISKKGGGPTLSLTTLIGVALGIIVIFFLLAVGMRVYSVLFGSTTSAPGTLTAYKVRIDIGHFLEDQKFIEKLDKEGFDYRNCLVPFELPKGQMIVSMSKNTKQIKVKKGKWGFDMLAKDTIIKRPRYCALETTCMFLCKSDCTENEILKHASFTHIDKIVSGDIKTSEQIKTIKMTITGKYPHFIINVNEAKPYENIQSCFAMRDQLKERRTIYDRVKAQQK